MTTTTSKAIHTNWKPAIAIPTSRRIEEFNSFSRFFLSFRSDSVLKACLLLIITLLYYMKKKNEKKNIPLTVCCCGFYIVCSSYMFFGFILTFIPSCFFSHFCCRQEIAFIVAIQNTTERGSQIELIFPSIFIWFTINYKSCACFFASILALLNFTCQL